MQIIHRISIASSGDVQRELARLCIVVADRGFVSFEVDESHEAWPALSDWIARRRAVDVVSTKFSKKEVSDARWLELMADWHHGYPQPNEDIFGYRPVTYDLTNWCSQCGVGMKQKAPFQMKGEPKWGKNGILQLNWVFDEYFVTPELWTGIFEQQGIGCRPVTNTKGDELKTVVQLVIEEEVGIVPKGLSFERCAKCARTKYLPVTRGPFPALAEEPTDAIAKTKEYFGSGGQADKRVVVSQKLAHSLAVAKVRGASVRPVQSNTQ
jgi:hypothetical protein